MNLLISFNNVFKWEGLVNMKWDNPLGYSNHALTQKLRQIAPCHTKLIKDDFLKDGVENICEIHL